MTRRKILVLVVFFIIVLRPIPSLAVGESGYNVPKNGTATWKVVKYDVDAFLYIKEDTTIHMEVINSSSDYINVILTSTDFVDEEPIIDYTDKRCFPFIVPVSFTNESNPIVDEIYTKKIFGVEREISVIIIESVKISDTQTADFILQYDRKTGLMIDWKISETLTDIELYTEIVLTETNFWMNETKNPLYVFYIENKAWLLPLFTLCIGGGVSYMIYYVISKKVPVPKKIGFSRPKE